METFSFGDHLRARLAAAAQVKERKRARMITSASGPSSSVPPAGGVVAVEDTDALDCGVCYLPLKPPIFQCDVGHVVCSPYRDKLRDNRKCHVCRGSTGGFRRRHAMERPVESARVACPNAAYGCAARPAYYEHFIGPAEALLDHFAGVHGWPCSTKVRTGEMFSVRLKDG
ncbi:E3 ubiquitin-protein ligase SINA-like 7 [Panicum miliaceum]|uniref:E3 ubiquitin-protein ligase SINA-like 7 n=1 Tax=Panicum miliaceum TaxID=4540 RepID=A0A3L6R7Y1_PANMI|nr:E3 ubiquitin-protein ligase SINA-like 7 [Panicum miliaceum]